MEHININNLLNRNSEVEKVKSFLLNFENNKKNLSIKKGLYIYGHTGCGKSIFITNILKELNYDIIKYDAGDIRNKSVIDTITKHNMSDKNIMSLFHKQRQPIAIIMDEMDGMNNGDKGGINALIKIIRPKKTKKQQLEDITNNPIICIGNYHVDKKIKELMKVCEIVELKSPSISQLTNIINLIIPDMSYELKLNFIEFVQGDLKKLHMIYNIYKNNNNIINATTMKSIFLLKSYNDNTRNITKNLINNDFSINQHQIVMNETDRTIVGLLWHENIIDVIEKYDKHESIPFYLKILNDICISDYIDRITFQKQIWQFNEMSSLIKTFKTNNIYHTTFKSKPVFDPSEIRFTKVLTKYSTEYNNYTFIQHLCQELNMDKKDMFAFFLDIKSKYDDFEILRLFENLEIQKLDINRIYRYIDKYIKETAIDVDKILIEDIDIDIDDNANCE